MAKTKQQPVHEVRLGAIKATIWENQTTYLRPNRGFTVSVERNPTVRKLH